MVACGCFDDVYVGLYFQDWVDVGVCFWWWLGLLGDLGAGLFLGDWFELGMTLVGGLGVGESFGG